MLFSQSLLEFCFQLLCFAIQGINVGPELVVLVDALLAFGWRLQRHFALVKSFLV
jgi:hypothetical protein